MWWELGSAGGVRFGPTLPVGLWSLRHELGGARGPVHPWVMGSLSGHVTEREGLARLWFKKNPRQQC